MHNIRLAFMYFTCLYVYRYLLFWTYLILFILFAIRRDKCEILNLYYIILCTHCVRNVNAALVIEGGRPRPRMISCHNFLVMTATMPPLWTTNLYRVYKSNTRLAMMGRRLIGVPIQNIYYNIGIVNCNIIKVYK